MSPDPSWGTHSTVQKSFQWYGRQSFWHPEQLHRSVTSLLQSHQPQPLQPLLIIQPSQPRYHSTEPSLNYIPTTPWPLQLLVDKFLYSILRLYFVQLYKLVHDTTCIQTCTRHDLYTNLYTTRLVYKLVHDCYHDHQLIQNIRSERSSSHLMIPDINRRPSQHAWRRIVYFILSKYNIPWKISWYNIVSYIKIFRKMRRIWIFLVAIRQPMRTGNKLAPNPPLPNLL